MKRTRRELSWCLTLVASMSTCVVFVTALSSARAAPAIQVPAVAYAFDGQGAGCGSQVLGVSNRGEQTVLTLFNRGQVRSEDSRLTGPAEVNVEVIIHNISGHIVAHGSLVLRPQAYPGSTWQSDFNVHVPGGKSIDVNGLIIVKDAQINARGTGSFAGQWFFIEHGIAPPPYPSDILALDPDGIGSGCEFHGEVWNGRVLNPNAL